MSGFEVVICSDGTEGMEMATTEKFDMVILDLMLPGTDGFEICKKIRETSEIPVMMVSAKKEDIDKIRGLGGFIEKVDDDDERAIQKFKLKVG